MEQKKIEMLENGGIDVAGTVARFSGNQDLFLMFLNKFTNDDSFNKIAPAFAANDAQEALNTTHSLKGVSGNLGMSELYDACSNTVALLRADKYEEAKASYQAIETAYHKVIDLIDKVGNE